MKTEFELKHNDNEIQHGVAKIIGERPDSKPYVMIILNKQNSLFFKDRDIERFAVNILKELKSNKLRNGNTKKKQT